MKIWLVTTGSSDVQLKTDEFWDDWHRLIKQQCYRLPFVPTQAVKDANDPYRIAPRALGMAYQACPDEVWGTLEFPLLKEFTARLKDEPIAQIILLLTDQSQIFDEIQRDDLKCPYWQDTCELQPIFERYFQTHFPQIKLVPLRIAPQQGESGLDNWNFVLDLVGSKLKEIASDSTTVYVSHQAGTPAISSAVQFASLAKFGDRVKFLVSNEYQREQTGFVKSSNYLRGIRIQEAKALLGKGSYNYAGVQALIESYLNEDAKILLNSAIQWNYGKFDDFADEIEKLSDQKFEFLIEQIKDRRQHWWWTAYEEVQLAVIRKSQGNIVEAFFHSFRAFEGIFAAWGKQKIGRHIEFIKGVPYLNPSILDDPEDYFSSKRCKDVSDLKNLKVKLENLRDETLEDIKTDQRVELNLATLCKMFRAYRYKDYKNNCPELKIFWDNDKGKNVCEKRNFIVHQLQGISESELQEFWDVKPPEEWKTKLLKFLTFISEEDLSEKSKPPEDASLMSKVHWKLQEVIDQL